MAGLTLKQVEAMIPEVAARLLDVRVQDLTGRWWGSEAEDELPAARLESDGQLSSSGRLFQPDLVLDTGWIKLVVVWRATSGAANILLAIRQLARHWPTRTVPVLVVPYMGATGAELCRQQGVSWFDLSGNADLKGPGLTIRFQGNANQHPRRGRPASVFAPRSVRVARLLIQNPEQVFSQKEMADRTGLDAGFVSRIVRGLEESGLVKREGRKIQAGGRSDLLMAWRDAADFSANRIITGRLDHLANENEFVAIYRKVMEALRDYEADYLATGLGAVHLLTGFSEFNHGVFYLREEPGAALRDSLPFQETAGEGNIWLVVPKDDGVFEGAVDGDGFRCAHPAQVFVDLKDMPGPVEKAGQMLRERAMDF